MITDLVAVVLLLLGAAVAAFAVGRPRMDAVALVMLAVLPLTRVVTMSEALAGFGDENVILIAALFVLGNGLVRTGVARGLGDWLTARAGSSELRLLALLMAVVAGAGAVMSSTAVTAIFIPVVLRIAGRTGISPRRLMMPLGVAALISGMMTLVATAPNLIVSGELEREGHAGFHFFSFTPFGLPILIVGILYMSGAPLAVARRPPGPHRGRSPEHARLGRRIPARRPRIPGPYHRSVATRGPGDWDIDPVDRAVRGLVSPGAPLGARVTARPACTRASPSLPVTRPPASTGLSCRPPRSSGSAPAG